MSVPDISQLPTPPDPSNSNSATPERKTVAAQLVELALQRYRLGITNDGAAFAVPNDGTMQHIAQPFRGGRLGLRQQLAAAYFAATGKVAAAAALADTLSTLEGRAQRLEPEPLHLRVAQHGGSLWYDLGTDDGSVVQLTPDGWHVVDTAPVLFTRTALTAPQVMPVRGGDVGQLFKFLNVAERDQALLLALLVAALVPEIPHPILTMTGEQGTGKSSAARTLVDLLDPSPVPLRKAPRDADAMVTAAQGSWVAALDNLTAISPWLSDALCRVVTGDGDVRRRLYTDGELAVLSYRRQFILTGIDFAGLHGDLAERLMTVELHTIPTSARKDEKSLASDWAACRASVLGGLFDTCCQMLKALPNIHLAELPRMADFAQIVAALDTVRGTDALRRYTEQANEIAADTLTASPFTETMLTKYLDAEFTAADLLDTITPIDPEWRQPKDWPRTARAVTSLLKRDAPALRKNGWVIDPSGENRDHTKLWRIRSPSQLER